MDRTWPGMAWHLSKSFLEPARRNICPKLVFNICFSAAGHGLLTSCIMQRLPLAATRERALPCKLLVATCLHGFEGTGLIQRLAYVT